MKKSAAQLAAEVAEHGGDDDEKLGEVPLSPAKKKPKKKDAPKQRKLKSKGSKVYTG